MSSSASSSASMENGQIHNNNSNRSTSTSTSTTTTARDSHPSCAPPSKVVHFRAVPAEAQEYHVLNLCRQFGDTVSCLMLKSKNQALVEFRDESAAVQLVNAFNSPSSSSSSRNECKIADRTVYVQYSNHSEIRLNEQRNALNGNNNMADSRRPFAVNSNSSNYLGASSPAYATANGAFVGNGRHQQVSTTTTNGNGNGGGGGGSAMSFRSSTSSSTNGGGHASNDSGMASAGGGGAHTILRVIFENMNQALNVDSLYAIFSRYGRVMKIITFVKEQSSQALVQFASRDRAAQCKGLLDTKCLFPGCMMRVEFSRLNNLEIRRNNERNRDYSMDMPPNNNGDVGSGGAMGNGLPPPHQQQQPGAGANAPNYQLPQQLAALLSTINPHVLSQLLNNSTGNNNNNLPNYSNAALQQQFNGGAGAGLLPQQTILQNLLPNLPPLAFLSGVNGGGPAGGMSNYNANIAAAAAAATGFATASVGTVGSPVVHVSNLNDTKVQPDTLFKLFGVYGDVQRVKIMFAKRDTALVQMSDVSQARNAIRNLDKARLYGRPLKLTSSNKPEVKLPHEGQDAKQDAGLTCNYANSPLHRFKRPLSSNYRNVYAPSDTLHLSNIPSTKTELDIREAFKAAGYEPLEFRYFTNDTRMALIQFASQEEAIEALIAMHNYDFNDNNYLRVSFSKSRISNK